jgi:hypothetical protein
LRVEVDGIVQFEPYKLAVTVDHCGGH